MYNKIQKTIAVKAPILGSSVDPHKVATSIKGAIIASTGLIIAGFGYFGVTVQVGEIKDIASAIPTLVDASVVIYGLVLSIYGIIRKIINRK